MKLANCKEHPENDPSLSCWAVRHDDGRKASPEEIIAAISDAAISEREACAKLCESRVPPDARHGTTDVEDESRACAEAIRMRSNVKYTP